jgi:hypothetical protein
VRSLLPSLLALPAMDCTTMIDRVENRWRSSPNFEDLNVGFVLCRVHLKHEFCSSRLLRVLPKIFHRKLSTKCRLSMARARHFFGSCGFSSAWLRLSMASARHGFSSAWLRLGTSSNSFDSCDFSSARHQLGVLRCFKYLQITGLI